MAKTVWVKIGNTLHQAEEGRQHILENPENKIYNLRQDPDTGEIYLEEIADGFDFNFKIYDLEEEFINHVITTYRNTSSNLGVLLSGKKGTGKTLTAKLIAQRIGKPVILVPHPLKGLQEFMIKFTSECVFFFDEFEKTFGFNKKDDNDLTAMLLSVMDGAYNTVCRQTYLITTNNDFIDENFLGRPSRIRYRKLFGNLPVKVVEEYIEDNLNDKSRKAEVIELVDSLALSTIDTLKAIVQDFNLHPGCSLHNIQEFLNLEFAKHRYNVSYKILRNNDPKQDTYTIADFLAEKAKIGTEDTYVDIDGTTHTYIIDEDHVRIYDRIVCTSRGINFLAIGDIFNNAPVVKPLDSNSTIITEDGTGTRIFYVVENPEYKPSLYGKAL